MYTPLINHHHHHIADAAKMPNLRITSSLGLLSFRMNTEAYPEYGDQTFYLHLGYARYKQALRMTTELQRDHL